MYITIICQLFYHKPKHACSYIAKQDTFLSVEYRDRIDYFLYFSTVFMQLSLLSQITYETRNHFSSNFNVDLFYNPTNALFTL
jgi:hypothetical protein